MRTQSTVLIAQSDVGSRFLAIERVQPNLYALCSLGRWVAIDMLERLRDSMTHQSVRVEAEGQNNVVLEEDEWWRPAAVKKELGLQISRTDALELAQKYKLRFDVNFAPRKKRSPSPACRPMRDEEVQEPTEPILAGVVEENFQGPEKLLDLIKSQYQEALYVSKASLAYFAKGPLSRARARFLVSDGSEFDRSHLLQSLRSMILSLPIIDKKYRDTLPELLRELPFNALSEDESASVIAVIKKRTRKSKKSQPGKNGLYPGEETSFAQWWLSRQTSNEQFESADAREESTKTILHEQRTRETQMQIILALETIALEASFPDSNTNRGVENDDVMTQDASQGKARKSKEPQNLSTLLDLLVDRLCIWQSMSLEGGESSAKDKRTISQQGGNTAPKTDQLRQFCIDVVIPFYCARLPEISTALCQKLGGPKDPSPKRPPLTKASSASSAPAKPGTAVQRQLLRKPRRTLQRVLTEERSASRRGSLSRSSTDPALPPLKREVSETLLSAIPANRAAISKRYSQREVDLQAASQLIEAKLNKKANIEQELQGAIQALKRPNPRMAVKELVEDAEKRAARHHPRKPKNPVRNPFAQGVQVMATPSKNRQGGIFAGLPRMAASHFEPQAELEEIPPSSISPIPCSTTKIFEQPALAGRTSTNRPQYLLASLNQTPTRGSSRFTGRPTSSSAAMRSGNKMSQTPLPSSYMRPQEAPAERDPPDALPRWPPNALATPPKPLKGLDNATPQTSEHAVQATPVKGPAIAPKTVETSPEAPPLPSSQEKEVSIYASLGWDDGPDELL